MLLAYAPEICDPAVDMKAWAIIIIMREIFAPLLNEGGSNKWSGNWENAAK
jgi:hypothetical protein